GAHQILGGDAETLQHRQSHGGRATGGEHDLVAESLHPPHLLEHSIAERAVLVHHGPVDVEGDQPTVHGSAAGHFCGSKISSPPIYGRSASGTITEPSACWCVSRIATSQRVVASVPLRVATGAVLPDSV